MSKKKPNIILIMADQMSADSLGVYGNLVVKSPFIDALGESGNVFDSCYCASPVCAPSRGGMMAGILPSQIGIFDNGSEFPASVPTFVHFLRSVGYHAVASGKLHFVGPDQLHGFETRLTTDIYPAGFNWTPADWIEGIQRNKGASARAILDSGICLRSLQIDYDEAVQFHALQFLYDQARQKDSPPFFFMISYTHPHDPFYITEEYWNRYRAEDIDLPVVPALSFKSMHPYDQWLHYHHEIDLYEIRTEHVINARRAYYGMISYVDDKIGQIMDTLALTGLKDDTIIIFTSDHGEMLGERGTWYKRSFYERSAKVPLIITGPGLKSKRIESPRSLLDVFPTILDVANIPTPPALNDTFGRSLFDLEKRSIISEYLGEGVMQPCRMLRDGPWKYVYTHTYPDQLFNIEKDPFELKNCAEEPEFEEITLQFRKTLLSGWNPDNERARVITSQKRRRFIKEAIKTGRTPSWDYEPERSQSLTYVRDADAQETSSRNRL